MERIKIAGIQMDIQFANPAANLHAMRHWLKQSTDQGAQITVFPECTTTGYCFQSLEEAKPYAQPLDGESVQAVLQLCQEFNTQIVFGLLELCQEQIFNTAVLVGPTGLLASYRKLHLPHLGVDRFTTPGDRPLEVVNLSELSGIPSDLNIGLNICYDISFPEPCRVLMLQGVDLVILPTNWPPTSGLVSDILPSARALENHIYFMSVNRVGAERGISFIGNSKICDPSGKVIASADRTEQTIILAEIDPRRSRQKHLVNIPGVHEVHRVEDRRPEMYEQVFSYKNSSFRP